MSGPPLSLMLLCALVAKGKACRVEQSLSAAEISRSVLVACAVCSEVDGRLHGNSSPGNAAGFEMRR